MATLEEISKIYEKFVSGTISPAERKQLFEFFDTADDDDIRTVISPYIDNEDEPKDLKQYDQVVDKIFAEVRARTQPVKKPNLWILYAAAVIAIAYFTVNHFYFAPKYLPRNPVVRDVAPGTTGATLTLADGSKISVGGKTIGAIVKQGEITIEKSAEGGLVYSGNEEEAMQNTLTTDRGQTFNLTLPDGTKVWLNAASSLTYNISLDKFAERSVELSGEGYFEVAHRKNQPFIVKSGKQRVQVLGTKFNVRTYIDDSEQITTLAEGSVRVYPSKDAKFLLLTPGNEIVNGNNRSYYRTADMGTALAWKEGKLYFKDATLVEVMKQVGRWYNIDVDYSSIKSNETFSGGIKRSANLSELLKIFELSGVHCMLTRTGNKITLTMKP